MNTATESKIRYAIAIMSPDNHIIASVWESNSDQDDFHVEKIRHFLTKTIKKPDDEHDPWNVFAVMPHGNAEEKIAFIQNVCGVDILDLGGVINRGMDSLDDLFAFAFNHRANIVFMLSESRNSIAPGWYECDLDGIAFNHIEGTELKVHLPFLR